jgi:hypothetical protein
VGKYRFGMVAVAALAVSCCVVPSVAQATTQSVTATAWSVGKSRTAHGGALLAASTTGASASFSLKRKTFAMWYVAGPAQGKLAVLVNGRRVTTIDQYAPKATRKSVALRGTKSVNTVQVVALSTRNSRSSGTKVNVDAFSASTSSCSASCIRNPIHTEVNVPSAVLSGDAAWYPTAVPDRSSPDWVVAVGSYVRGQDVTPIDTAVPVIRAAACDQARKVPRGIVVLSFGRQVEGGTNGFGRTIPYSTIVATSAAWAAGLAECGTGPWEVSIGTSNSGSVTAHNGFMGGATWGRMVEQARAASDARVAISAAVDLEPGWGPPGQARSWVDGFVRASSIRLWNFGSADGCPQTVSSDLTCNNGWTIDDVLWVSSHAGPNVFAMPQIHTQSGSQSRQWAVMAARAASMAMPLRLGAITIQTSACSQVRGGCPTTGISAWDGWSQLRRAIDAIPGAVGTPVGAPMDIRWGWANGFVIPPATTTTTTTTTSTTSTTTTTTSTTTTTTTTVPPSPPTT